MTRGRSKIFRKNLDFGCHLLRSFWVPFQCEGPICRRWSSSFCIESTFRRSRFYVLFIQFEFSRLFGNPNHPLITKLYLWSPWMANVLTMVRPLTILTHTKKETRTRIRRTFKDKSRWIYFQKAVFAEFSSFFIMFCWLRAGLCVNSTAHTVYVNR